MNHVFNALKTFLQMSFAALLILAGAVIRDPFMEGEEVAVVAAKKEKEEKNHGG